MTFINPTLARLCNAKPVTGVALDIARSVDVARLMSYAGFHFMTIRGSPGGMDVDLAGQIAITSLDVGIDVFVHVGRSEYAEAARLMDNGATGALVQGVNDVGAAREAVSRLKYPPMGHRSVGPTPQLGDANLGKKAAAVLMNANTLLAIVIDTIDGLHHVGAIADVDGVDAVLFDDERLADDSDGVLRNAAFELLRARPVHWGAIVAAGLEGSAQMYRHYGGQFFLTTSDSHLLENAVAERMQFLRTLGASTDEN